MRKNKVLLFISLIVLLLVLLSACRTISFDELLMVEETNSEVNAETVELVLDNYESDNEEQQDILPNEPIPPEEKIPSEVFDEFLNMIKETEWVWHTMEKCDFTKVSTSVIIDKVLLAYPYYEYGLYDYLGYEFSCVQPPEYNSFDYEKAVDNFDTDGLHWILKNVFDRDPDYSTGDYHSYKNGKIYVKARLGIGTEGYQVKALTLDKATPLGNRTYEIVVSSKFTDYWTESGEPEDRVYNYIFTAVLDKDDNGNYLWKLRNFERKER